MSAHFEDGKDEGALRTIGEVSKALNIKTHVLRYWEQQFPMLEPLKRSGGRRYYRSEDVALIEMIDRLVNHEGYTLKGALKAIRDGSVADSPAVVSTDDEPAAHAIAAKEAAPVASGIVSSPDQSIAADGGVGDFFGTSAPELAPESAAKSASPSAPPLAAQTAIDSSPDETSQRSEILAKLKDLRADLARALAA